ncbi:exosome complex RNA-binding protein Csl4 [Methanohalophilus sp.]|uniref:exosome complex RNA-binding protein Csl4 n=1 Tax=Methanohalophilus sp. TaxID=1966352 RepID=UPI0026384C48|nr:exosome complex RNA-binding protein Csl4 [Methanohalophilus sp.]MDK2891734.1 exosome complex component [Methanohalophilus sp.]
MKSELIEGDETVGEVEEVGKTDESPEEKELEEHFVLPGEVVGITEEFKGGDGTYTVRGDILASRIGTVQINRKKREVSVKPASGIPPVVKKGDIVVGMIINLRDSMALVKIAAIKGYGEREIKDPGIAAIHISNIRDSYVKNIADEFGLGDIVKAKVIDIENMRLSTAEKDLGVMSAMCPRCGTVMQKDERRLKCPACGNVEKRNLSSDYGSGEI